MSRTRVWIEAIAIALLLTACSSNRSHDMSLKQGAKDVGRTLGAATHEVAQDAKKVGKTVAEAAKEGGKAFKDAMK